MEKVLKLFKHDLKTSRLELRVIHPTKKLAKDFWNIIKNEKPDDFKYAGFSLDYVAPLPISEQETFDLLVKEAQKPNAVNYAVYNNNNLIGFVEIIYWENDTNPENTTLEIAEIWFVKSARGKGFAKEINTTMERIALTEPRISRMGWRCDEQNIGSKMAAQNSGYNLLKTMEPLPEKGYVRLVFVKSLHVQ